ncbi:hypothetical protein JCM24511_08635 [Saitozyma sp. JCM 24511]|nr:hypothetical protein JCM24511_08635 [Saitozyma sp. JCM 24511]
MFAAEESPEEAAGYQFGTAASVDTVRIGAKGMDEIGGTRSATANEEDDRDDDDEDEVGSRSSYRALIARNSADETISHVDALVEAA